MVPSPRDGAAALAAGSHGLARIGKDAKQVQRFAVLLSSGFTAGIPSAPLGAGASARCLIGAFAQPIGDSLTGIDGQGRPGILDALRQVARTFTYGAGVGIDFSALRAAGSSVAATGCRAAGPVGYRRLVEELRQTVRCPDAKPGALAAQLRIDHPDIEAFLHTAGSQDACELSIAVPDLFMKAVVTESEFTLTQPDRPAGRATGSAEDDGAAVRRGLRARELWDQLLRRVCADPPASLVFTGRAHAGSSFAYGEQVQTLAPGCGQLLPAHGGLPTGCLDLRAFVHPQHGPAARFDHDGFAQQAAVAVEFLDRVIDVSAWPLPQQEVEAKMRRRIGLSCSGLENAMRALAIERCGPQETAFATGIHELLRDSAFRSSIQLAKADRAYPLFNAERYLRADKFAAGLSQSLQGAIRLHGLRNSQLLSLDLDPSQLPQALIGPLGTLVDGTVRMVIDTKSLRPLEAIAQTCLYCWRAGMKVISFKP